MHVLYFHQYFSTRSGAHATRSYEVARRLVARGHSVTMVTRDTRGDEPNSDAAGRPAYTLVDRRTVDGIDVVYIAMPYSNYFSTALRLASFAGFTVAATVAGLVLPRPDVVFATSTPLTIGVPGLVAARCRQVPFVFEIRDLWPAVPAQMGVLRPGPLLAAAEWLETALYRAARQVIVLSEGSRDALLAQGVPEEKLVFAPNASDLDLFHPAAADTAFRGRHGLDGKFVAVYTGALGHANGPHQMLDAALLLQRSGNDTVHLVIAGDGAERPGLQTRIEQQQLRNVTLLPPLPKTQIAGIVAAADVSMTLFAPYPILASNSPNKLFDSLAAGTPVIVNLDGWLRRVIEGSAAGVYVPPADPHALAATLAALAEEPRVVRTMGSNARALAEAEFDRDRVVDRVASALEGAAHAG